MKITDILFGISVIYSYICIVKLKQIIMSVEKLIKLLEAKFPKAWFKHGKEFGDDTTTAVWTGEGSYVDSDENIPMFDYDNMTDSYDFGAHVELCKFVEEHGYYVEPYDAGTYFIYPN